MRYNHDALRRQVRNGWLRVDQVGNVAELSESDVVMCGEAELISDVWIQPGSSNLLSHIKHC